MAEEIDDNEFFQQDFTTASEWEIFNARLDEIFHDWKLPFVGGSGTKLKKLELYRADWEIKSERIFFADVELNVSYYCAKLSDDENETEKQEPEEREKVHQTAVDLMSLENNFPAGETENVHPLARWYGLRAFVVIEPVDASIVNESQFRVLLSSAAITVAETNTQVPVFVHVMQKKLNVFLGVCELPSTRINFDIVALETTPPTCKYLSGLLCIFKGKVQGNYIKPVTVSVRLSYSLKDFISATFSVKSKIPFSIDSEEEEEAASSSVGTKFFALPYGVSIDPISELVLNCSWPEIAENIIVDSANYSDLDPKLAPFWTIRADFKTQPIYYLSDSLGEYLTLFENTRSLGSVVGSSYDFGGSQNLEAGNPFDLLTESKIPSIASVLPISKPKERKKLEGTIKDEELMQMLYYMFPDAHKDALFSYEKIYKQDGFDPLRIKSAQPDSLVLRLSSLLATCNSYFGGIVAVAQLWAEFTQEMRYRVERCIQIPGVATGFPDSRTCLLHQKLQMLNICMERRRVREGGLPFAMTSPDPRPSISESEGEEDEFFDCATDEEEKHEPWNKPEGRLHQLDHLKLIDSDEGLYVPITQEPVPKTEDQLEDDAEVMLKLGPGSELCTQMMSASLLSDMESFKAANPNGKIEDFIRWCSPRDWIEETDEEGKVTGQLSQRMLIPGNTWQTVWSQAKPVPARRQKRLFDDTKEAEKVLHYFETRTLGQICQLTVSSLFHSAVLKLKDETQSQNTADCLKENFDKILSNLCKVSRETLLPDSVSGLNMPSLAKKWDAVLQEIANVEHLTMQIKSLAKKLAKGSEHLSASEQDMILTLLKGAEASLENGIHSVTAQRILELFDEARQSKSEFAIENEDASKGILPEPFRKEYVLRVDGKITDRGVGGPQFLRAILDKHMRLCGAFSENTTFV